MTDEERRAVVLYRIENAQNTLREIPDHCKYGYWNTAVNRLYYACFYAVSALLVSHGIETKSHDGVRQMFGKYFIMTQKLPVEFGHFYSVLFNKRSSGDYEDFINHTQETVDALYPQAQELIKRIQQLLQD